MADPATAREALIVEALGEVARLIRQVEGLEPVLAQSCQAVKQANALLNDNLVDFERRMTAIAENAKGRAVQHVAARIDDALRRSIDQQSRAMADAARVAFGAELGATVQRLQSTLQALMERPRRRWEWWLVHAGVAAAASALTWGLAAYVCAG
jgi:hypothetical protein